MPLSMYNLSFKTSTTKCTWEKNVKTYLIPAFVLVTLHALKVEISLQMSL